VRLWHFFFLLLFFRHILFTTLFSCFFSPDIWFVPDPFAGCVCIYM
jgi:hypothetical protein